MKTKLNRIEVGGAGTGEFSQADVERRAHELAVSDGRAQANEIDRRQARVEFGDQNPVADPGDDISEDDRPGAGWPATDEGTRTARVELDDEVNLAESLVEEGIAEAEHDSRLHSNDDQFDADAN